MTKLPDELMKDHTQEYNAKSRLDPESRVADKSPEVDEKKHTKRPVAQNQPKESYDDYIKALPPPFWEMKKPPPFSGSDASNAPPRRAQDRSAEEIAASINAVCAPITAADRAEDARKNSRSLRERWKDWKEDKGKGNSVVDRRPIERGSSTRLTVWGTPLTDKGRFKR